MPLDHSATSPCPDCDALADILLSEIAAGFQSLASIASEHKIPYPKFTLWLLQPETQQKLTALSSAVASAARLTATAALPDIVRNLKATVEQLGSQSGSLLAHASTDPLKLQALTLRRHRAVISASALLYRISRFTVPTPSCHRPPSRSDAIGAPAPPPRGGGGGAAAGGGNVPLLPSSTGSSTAFSSASPAAALPRLADFEHFGDTDHCSSPSTSPRVEVRPQAGEGAPAFSPGSSPAFSTSPLPSKQQPPCADPEDLDPPMTQEEAIEHLQEEFELTDVQVVELRKDPANWLRANILAPRGLIDLNAHASADDG